MITAPPTPVVEHHGLAGGDGPLGAVKGEAEGVLPRLPGGAGLFRHAVADSGPEPDGAVQPGAGDQVQPRPLQGAGKEAGVV